MNPKNYILSIALLAALSAASCKSKIKIKEDELYSRHLQRHVKLGIVSTPMPDEKEKMNLLILNDGQEMEAFRVKDILDSLYKKGAIQPLLIVGIQAGDRMREFGVEGKPDFQKRGDKAGNYAAFIDNELYPFIKKKAGLRKFSSIAIAGCSLGGLSAFDIAWNHADKIDKVGVFSGSFWWRDKDISDPGYSDSLNRVMISEIRSSRKRPKTDFWFYAGGNEETSDRDKDGITDVMDDTKDLIAVIKKKNIPGATSLVYVEGATGKHNYTAWSKQLPAFLIWAFGK
jgi:enterochelin esterase-like enzyme